MSSSKSDSNNKEEQASKNLPHYSSGMTPSIITTINNTSPTPLVDNLNNNTNGNLISKTRNRTNEPYESYIEDSFVGHWEREDDDDTLDEYQANHREGGTNEAEEDESALHPSTIEFDFDSFGPESFIYTPNTTNKQVNEAETSDNNGATTSNNLERDVKQAKDDQPTRVPDSGTNPQPQPQQQQPTPRVLSLSPVDYLVDPAQIDLKVIEPYKKVISHAGYCHHFDPSAPPAKPGEPAPAIIVFSACYLPDRSRRDYNYVMDHLFLYVLSSLHELIADDYILIYLHNTQPSTTTVNASLRTPSSGNVINGSTSSSSTANEESHPQNNLPTFTWMKRCYQMIDRKLRKNLKILYLVRPTFWLKTIVIMCKPFISAKFSKKLRFVENMDGLKKCLPVDKLILPASAQNI